MKPPNAYTNSASKVWTNNSKQSHLETCMTTLGNLNLKEQNFNRPSAYLTFQIMNFLMPS